jgi:hypothetical protein
VVPNAIKVISAIKEGIPISDLIPELQVKTVYQSCSSLKSTAVKLHQSPGMIILNQVLFKYSKAGIGEVWIE